MFRLNLFVSGKSFNNAVHLDLGFYSRAAALKKKIIYSLFADIQN